jgi:hypothetical protein
MRYYRAVRASERRTAASRHRTGREEAPRRNRDGPVQAVRVVPREPHEITFKERVV